MADPAPATFKQFQEDQKRAGTSDADTRALWNTLTRGNQPTTVDIVPPAPTKPGPTTESPSLANLSADLMGPSISQFTLLGERRAKRFEAGAAETEEVARGIRDLARKQEAERAAARPTPPALPTPPSVSARPFLQPGESMLGQLQSVLQGIGLVATGIMGGKGTGYAIAATAALKGAAEGWQQGDNLRVQHELEHWKVSHEHLMAEYQLQRDAFNDLLTNQKLTMDERFAQLRIRAELMGAKDLADQARQGNITAVLDYAAKLDASTLAHKKVAAELEHWRAQAEQHQQNYLATEAHRRETEARAREAGARSERRTQLLEDTSGSLLKLQQSEIGLRQRLTNAQVVREAVEVLDREGILPKGSTFWDKAQAAIALQSKPGRQDIAQAVQVLQRLGTPLVVSTEIALGMQGQTMRLKVIGEAEAGNIAGAPKAFWDLFLPKAEATYREQLTVTQEHLKRLNLLQRPSATEDGVTIERVE